MGADFIVQTLPAAKKTEARWGQAMDLILALPMLPLWEDTFTDEELSRQQKLMIQRNELLKALNCYWIADTRDDVAMLRPEGCPYTLYVTGGQSWGDSPNEACERFAKIAEVDSLVALLRKFAIEDTNQLPATATG